MSEREIVLQALDIQDRAERAAFLDQACRDQPSLRAAVDQLLQAQERAGTLLDESPPALAVAAEETRDFDAHPGQIIAGKYKLLQKIGEGGMGSVWMADQTEPVKRRVAVKLIGSERGNSKSILSRFEAERQAIALMDHPHIAKLLDAGSTGGERGGCPLFVMELVKGVSLTEFCDEHKLSIPERLNLFMHICSAVRHPHQKGIIHRDLKPTNILIELHDDKPVPKVIDFGLAKAMSGQPLSEHTLFTGFGTVAGTPLYMAPEQAKFNAIDIDTRADIYALGVILYELLTGSTPIERGALKQAALDEVLRLIRESEPQTPSRRLSTAQTKPSIAANRHTEPQKLGRFVKGELDWIVMKALAKERDRRYETANGFARDIERFLNHEPVLAGPPSTSYRLRKFVQRNQGQVMAAALVLLALVVGIAGTTIGLIRAEQQRRLAEANELKATEAAESERKARDQEAAQRAKAEQARDRTRQALDAMTSTATGDELTTQKEISADQKKFLTEVLKYYQQFAGEKADDEKSRVRTAAAAYRVGTIESRLGRKEQAARAFQMAADGYTTLIADFPTVSEYRHQLGRSHNAVAEALLGTGRGPAAAEHFRKAIELLTQLTADDPAAPQYRAELARSHHGLGKLHKQQGERSAAEVSFQKALDIQNKLSAGFPSVAQYRADLAEIHRNLGCWLEGSHWLSSSPEEIDHVRRACKLFKDLVVEYPDVTQYRFRLAAMLDVLALYAGPAEERIDSDRQAIDITTRLTAEFPQVPDYRALMAVCCANLGDIYRMKGEWETAAKYFRESLDVQTTLVTQYPSVASYRKNMVCNLVLWGEVLIYRGDFAGGRKAFEEAVSRAQADSQIYGNDPWYAQYRLLGSYLLSVTLVALGDSTEAAKRLREGDQVLSDAWRQLRTVRGPSTAASFCADVATELGYVGDGLKKKGRHQEIANVSEIAVKALAQAIELDPKNAGLRNSRASLYMQVGQRDKAVADYSKAIELQPTNAEFWNSRGSLYMQVGQWEKALADCTRVIDLDPKFVAAWNNRGWIYGNLGQGEKALADCTKAIDLDPKFVAAWNNRGWIYGNLGQGEKALADCTKAIGLDPKLGYVWSNRGWIYGNLRQWEKALADCTRAIELDPKLVYAWNNRGWIYGNLGQWEKALADCTKAIELDPKFEAAWKSRGWIYGNLGQGHRSQGDLLQRQGKRSEAREEYRKALAIQEKLAADFPTVPEYRRQLARTHTTLGILLHELGKRSEEEEENHKAMAIQENLAADYPKVPAYRHDLGNSRAYRALSRINAGHVSEGIAEIAESAKSSNWNRENWYNFACAYAVAAGKSGHKKQEYGDRAMELLNKAVEAGIKDPAQLKQDPDLNSLHDRDEFKKLVAKLTNGKQAAKKP